jgi:hypothetical protein
VRISGPARRSSLAIGAVTGLAMIIAGCGAAGHRDAAGLDSKTGTGKSSDGTGRDAASARVRASATAAAAAAAAAKVKHADFLDGVSCASPSSCFAVGSYYYGSAGPVRPLVVRWDGARWRVQMLPAEARHGSLDAVSCPTTTSCTAVGSEIVGWTGQAWHVERRNTSFDAVSCPTSAACVAVGQTSSGVALAGVLTSGAWRISRLPAVFRRVQSETMTGVSCWAPASCLAVGDYSYGATAMPSRSFRDKILAERWNGTKWTVIRALNVARRNRLAAISCAEPRRCIAVGQAGSKVTLAESWNGRGWRHERTPNFDQVGYSELTGVSCPSATSCVAVGDLDLGTPSSQTYDGTAWTIARMASSQVGRALQGLTVSCSGTTCEMVGSDGGGTLAEAWTGSSWQFQVTPDPH